MGALLALALDLAVADQAIKPRAGLASIKGADQPRDRGAGYTFNKLVVYKIGVKVTKFLDSILSTVLISPTPKRPLPAKMTAEVGFHAPDPTAPLVHAEDASATKVSMPPACSGLKAEDHPTFG